MAQPPHLRLVLAVSLDGRLAPAGGGAAQIGGPADRRQLEQALAWADGCLIGAETLRLHGSTCLIHAPDLLAERLQAGRPPQPVAVAVSRSGNLPPGLPFFRQPLRRWWLGAPDGESARPGGAANSAAVSTDPPLPTGFDRHLPGRPWPVALAALAALGLERIAVLGGAHLAAGLLAEEVVEELQLTLCPRLLGGPHVWLPPELALPDRAQWHLAESRPLEGDELLLRYRRRAQGARPSPG